MQLFILSAFIILLVLALTYAVLVFWLLVDAIIDRKFQTPSKPHIRAE